MFTNLGQKAIYFIFTQNSRKKINLRLINVSKFFGNCIFVRKVFSRKIHAFLKILFHQNILCVYARKLSISDMFETSSIGPV